MLYERLVDVLVIGETKLDDSFLDAQFKVDGYQLFRNDRNGDGGGVMAYVRSDIPCRRRKETEPEQVEAVEEY